MRVFLRSAETGMFFVRAGEWTPRPKEAFDFEETSRALDATSQSEASDLEVVMNFAEPDFEIPLKIVGLGG